MYNLFNSPTSYTRHFANECSMQGLVEFQAEDGERVADIQIEQLQCTYMLSLLLKIYVQYLHVS